MLWGVFVCLFDVYLKSKDVVMKILSKEFIGHRNNSRTETGGIDKPCCNCFEIRLVLLKRGKEKHIH